jgi:hypothetical protein
MCACVSMYLCVCMSTCVYVCVYLIINVSAGTKSHERKCVFERLRTCVRVFCVCECEH